VATSQAVWGIDLGRAALKAIKLRNVGEGKVEILDIDFIEHEKVLSQPDADRGELISSALEKFLSRRDITRDGVVVNVPGQHTLSRFTKLPPVAPKRIPDIVRYEADQQIPFDLDEVIWDYQTFQQEGMPDLEVGIFAMKRELIREHLLHFEQAQIEPIAVQSTPLSVYNAARFDGMLSKDTTIVLDIGSENTDLIIGTADTLWTRTVPIGGNALTEALVKSFKLSFSKAEQLKRTAATSKYSRQIFQAMRPVFADLVQELQRSIGFYSSTHRDAEINKVVGMGNAFKLPGLQKYLKQNLGIEIELPEQFKSANSDQLADADVLRDQFPSFASAFGLAIQGLDQALVSSNLLPTEIAKQAVWRKKKPAFAAAAACIVLAGGLTWFRQVTDMGALAAGNDAPPSISSIEDAGRIIDNGAAPSLSTRARAKAIIEAGDVLKRELGRLRGQGDTERADTEQLIELHLQKNIPVRILDIIHESAPRSSPVADLTDPLKIREKLGSAVPRKKRSDVIVDKVLLHYEPNLNAYDFTSFVAVPPPMSDYEFGSSAKLPGFLVKIMCRSAHEDTISFISEKFMTPLRRKGQQPDMGFYFDQVSLISGQKRTSKTRGGGGLGLRARGGGGASAGGVRPESLDPVTLEPKADDWSYEIWIAVLLENSPGVVEDVVDEPEAEEGD